MPAIAEPLSPARVLTKAKRFAPLKSFSAGRQGNQWETFINEWVRSAYQGSLAEPQTIVVLEDAHGKLVGISSFGPRSLPGSERVSGRLAKLVGHSQCVHTIATDRLYRGQRLQDGSRLGDVLLRQTLAHLDRLCEGRTPAVWALVAAQNTRARALMLRHDFREMPYSGEGEIAYVHSPHGRSGSTGAGVSFARRLKRMLGRTDAPTQAADAEQ